MPRWQVFIAVVITVVWAMLYLRALFDPTFQPSSNVSTVMLVVASWLFATDVIRRRKNGGGG